jgi:hypothetical protein
VEEKRNISNFFEAMLSMFKLICNFAFRANIRVMASAIQSFINVVELTKRKLGHEVVKFASFRLI